MKKSNNCSIEIKTQWINSRKGIIASFYFVSFIVVNKITFMLTFYVPMVCVSTKSVS